MNIWKLAPFVCACTKREQLHSTHDKQILNHINFLFSLFFFTKHLSLAHTHLFRRRLVKSLTSLHGWHLPNLENWILLSFHVAPHSNCLVWFYERVTVKLLNHRKIEHSCCLASYYAYACCWQNRVALVTFLFWDLRACFSLSVKNNGESQSKKEWKSLERLAKCFWFIDFEITFSLLWNS